MSELMKALYSYIQEHLDVWLCQDPEYLQFAANAEAQEAKLRASLDPEELKVYNALRDEQLGAYSVEREAIFQATLSLCRELGRLGAQV